MSYGNVSRHTPTKLTPDRKDASYEADRERWRASLSDAEVRALAYEWKIGIEDDCTYDAWIEYEERFGERANGPRQEYTKKLRKRAPKESRRRKARGI